MSFFPVVRIGRNDWCRLMQLAFDPKNNAHPAAVLLRSEVHRAIVTDDVGLKETVQLNVRVRYQLDGEQPMERLLVLPNDYRTDESDLSVLTSLGAALIGIRVGDAMPFICTKGNLHMVVVLSALQDRKEPFSVWPIPARRRDACVSNGNV